MTTKNSKYEIKQWLNQIYHWMKQKGKTEYTHYELPKHLQNHSFHLSAARMELIHDTGGISLKGTKYQKIWRLNLRYIEAWQREKARELLNAGKSVKAVAKQVSMSANTIKRELCEVS